MAQETSADDENLLGLGARKAPPSSAMPAPPPAALSPPADMPALPTVATPALSVPAGADGLWSQNGEGVANKYTALARGTWDTSRSWSDFFSTRAFNRPSFANLSERIKANVAEFQSNYIVIGFIWLTLYVISSIPSFLLTAFALVLLHRRYTRRAQKNGGSLPPEELLIFVALILLLMWLTGIYHNVLGALFCTAATCGVHASLHEPPHQFLPPPAVAS